MGERKLILGIISFVIGVVLFFATLFAPIETFLWNFGLIFGGAGFVMAIYGIGVIWEEVR
jgi:hypothetical protein